MERENPEHIEEERLEAYAIHALSEEQVEIIEEHLFFCIACQDRRETVERYVRAMQSAAKRIRTEETVTPATAGATGWLRSWLHTPAPFWAGAFATLSLIIILLVGLPSQQPPGPPVDVELQAVRGASSGVALAGHALHLRLDNHGVPELPAWRIEIVGEEGARIWNGTGTWSDNFINATVDKSFQPGTYFIRLLKDGEDPVREFQLIVQKAVP